MQCAHLNLVLVLLKDALTVQLLRRSDQSVLGSPLVRVEHYRLERLQVTKRTRGCMQWSAQLFLHSSFALVGTHLERLQARPLPDRIELAQDCVLDGLVLAQLGKVGRGGDVDSLVLNQLAQIRLVREDDLQAIEAQRQLGPSVGEDR